MSWWSKLWAKPEPDLPALAKPEPDLPALAERRLGWLTAEIQREEHKLAAMRKALSDARCEWSQSDVISKRVLQQRLEASQQTNRYLFELVQQSLRDTQAEIYKRLRFEEAHKHD